MAQSLIGYNNKPVLFPPLSTGVDSMSNYEQVIRQVRYYNWRPGQLTERRFRLTCSELNGRYTSNEFNLEVGVTSSLTDVALQRSTLTHIFLG